MPLIDLIASCLRLPDGRPTREIQADIREELEFHLALATEDHERGGMPAAEARQEALRRFGDLSAIESTCRRVQLGERRMLQRVQVSLTLVGVATLLLLIVTAYRNQTHQDAALVELQRSVQRLQDNLSIIVDRAPPVVVETFPVSGAIDVDPATPEIRVTFSKTMMDESWSWCQTEYPFPKSVGSIYFSDDRKTCVLPVELQPNTEYVVSLNSPRYRNFKDPHGRAAEPYVLTFTTASSL